VKTTIITLPKSGRKGLRRALARKINGHFYLYGVTNPF
jgi:hypothetical protein